MVMESHLLIVDREAAERRARMAAQREARLARDARTLAETPPETLRAWAEDAAT